ncbi:hypothetical protein Tco_0788998 [Tanacetum coccineum]
MTFGYQNTFYLKQAQKKQQSLYNGKVLLDNHEPLAVYDSEKTLQLTHESNLKMKQQDKEIKQANYAKINKLSEVFVSQMAKSQEEVYFSNTSKKTYISKPILIHDDEFLDDTSKKCVARKFLNEVKETIVTLQHVVKSKMSLNTSTWSSHIHQEIQKVFNDEIASIMNQIDVRVIHFEKEFLKEATNFVRDYKSLAKEVDESLEKIRCLECENEHLLKAVVVMI